MSFHEEVLTQLNDFREKPATFIETLEKVKLNLGQMSKNSKTTEFIKDIDSFIPVITKASGLAEFKPSQELRAAALQQLDNFSENGVQYNIKQAELVNLLKEYCEGFNNVAMLINDAEEAEEVLTRMVFANTDKEKKNRKALLDPKMTYVGIGDKNIDGDNYVIIIVADNVTKIKPKETIQGIDELKQAFDFFDVNESGRINIKDLLTALKSLGFNGKNPSLFAVMNELDHQENEKKGIDWDTFKEHVVSRTNGVTTKEAMKRVFDIFIDDPVQDTVTLTTLKRICKELGEDIRTEELQDLIQKAANNGTELTFEEFYTYMTATNAK
jgi:Ca2+-binding EF-hand superfamily protein